jgi:hypothetical protein
MTKTSQKTRKPEISEEDAEKFLAEVTAKDPGLAEEARRAETRQNGQRQFFIDDFPLHIVHALVDKDALHAFPLVLAAHRVMCMRRRGTIRLTRRIWEGAGYPSAKDQRRRVVLEHLRKIPNVMALIDKRAKSGRYLLRRGLLWNKAPKLRIFNETYTEEDD